MTDQQWETRVRLLAEGWRELEGYGEWPTFLSADGIHKVFIRIDGVVESTGGPVAIAPYPAP